MMDCPGDGIEWSGSCVGGVPLWLWLQGSCRYGVAAVRASQVWWAESENNSFFWVQNITHIELSNSCEAILKSEYIL